MRKEGEGEERERGCEKRGKEGVRQERKKESGCERMRELG